MCKLEGLLCYKARKDGTLPKEMKTCTRKEMGRWQERDLQYTEKSFGFCAVEHPFCNSAVELIFTLTASLPKKLCMWLLYWPGMTMGSMFLRMKKSTLVFVKAAAGPIVVAAAAAAKSSTRLSDDFIL